MLFGADPEFLVLREDGTKVTNLQDYFDHLSPVGWDHNGRVLELHPEPAESAKELTINVKNLILSAKETLPGSYRLVACTFFRGDVDSFGSHFHISHEPMPTNWWDGLLQVLGAYVGVPCLLLHDDFDDVLRRYQNQGKGYGGVTDHRQCWFGMEESHRRAVTGTPNGIEYRSVGGVVSSRPKLYYAVASLIESLSKAYINGFDFPKMLPGFSSIYRDRTIALEYLERYEVWETLSNLIDTDIFTPIKEIVEAGGFYPQLRNITGAWSNFEVN